MRQITKYKIIRWVMRVLNYNAPIMEGTINHVHTDCVRLTTEVNIPEEFVNYHSMDTVHKKLMEEMKPAIFQCATISVRPGMNGGLCYTAELFIEKKGK